MMQMNMSSVSKIILTISVCCLFLACSSTKINEDNGQPLWADTETLSQAFPEEEFIARIGYGNDENIANLNADAEISSFFFHTVSVQSSANEKMFSNENVTEIIRNVNRKIETNSDSELIALRHTDSWYDRNRKRYIVCAYIDKKEAWRIIEPKIRSEAIAFENEYKESKAQPDGFLNVCFLNSALKHYEDFYDLYNFVMIIFPERINQFSEINKLFQQARIEKQKLQSVVHIDLKISGDTTNRIKTKMNQLLSEEGFSIGSVKSFYVAKISIELSSFENDDVYISYPQISISIEKKDGETIVSWAKQFSKISAYSKEACERMSLNKIEKELESNFITNVINARGTK